MFVIFMSLHRHKKWPSAIIRDKIKKVLRYRFIRVCDKLLPVTETNSNWKIVKWQTVTTKLLHTWNVMVMHCYSPIMLQIQNLSKTKWCTNYISKLEIIISTEFLVSKYNVSHMQNLTCWIPNVFQVS